MPAAQAFSRHPVHGAPKIHALTSLRFFAALYVVFYHTVWTPYPSISHSSLTGRFYSLGIISVSFFFLLSGYILAMVYLKPDQPIQKRSFYISRFARIYPLFLLTLVLDTPNLLFERISHYGLASAVLKTSVTFTANLMMLQAWFGGLRGIDNPNWSLSVETVFYLIFPLIGVWIWKLGKSWVWFATGLFWVGGQLLVRFVDIFHVSGIIEFFPPLHVSTFVLGILVAKLQCQRQVSNRLPSTKKLGRWCLLLVSLTILCVVVVWSPWIPQAQLSDGLLSPVFAMMIWALADNAFLPARLLSSRWLVLLGEASFGLYLIHIPVFHLFERLHLASIPTFYLLYLAVCIGMSILSFYFFETPSRKWALRQLGARTRESMEVASDAQ